MSDNAERIEQSEQITKTPSNVPKREKDPKRVAAGKKLAKSNKRMKEEHAKYKALEAQRIPEATTETPATDDGLLSKLSFTNVISLVGIGLAVYNIYTRSKDNVPTNEKQVEWREPVATTCETPKMKQEMKPKPKFGM